ncbi:MAG: hypothetical protein AB7G44_03700 [Bacteroidia bacterium]
MKIRCKVNYRSIKKSLLAGFANNVLNTLYVNTAIFLTPPLPAATLLALKIDFDDKYDRYTKRTISKGDMLASRAALIAALDTLSAYVNTVADGDAIIILEGGFEPTKGNANNANPPAQPVGVTLERGSSRELIADCTPADGVMFNGAVLIANHELPENITISDGGQIVVEDDGTVTPSSAASGIQYILDLNKGRKKSFKNLQVGVTYYVYFWAANTAGVSILSEMASKKVVE